MSYLQLPRLHFTGAFVAEPSTINNDPANIIGPIGDPGWNPGGNHEFAFTGCRVTALADAGQFVTQGDPLIGAPVSTPGTPSAKLVDLDVEVQLASTIYGLVVAIADSAGNSVRGTMASASFRDFSGARLLGIYQSTLTALEWQVSPGAWLAKLQSASQDALSIRFVADLYTGFSGGPHRGRLAGAIGPATDSEPSHYVAGRRLVGVQGPSALAEVRATGLTIDVGNIVPVKPDQSFEYPTLTVAVKSTSRHQDFALKTGAVAFAPPTLPSGWRRLGAVTTTVERYLVTGGVESLTLSAQDAAAVTSAPLGLFTPAGAALALEADDGLFVCPDRWALAMNPGDQQSVMLTAVRFGTPAPGATILLEQTTNAGAAGITFPQSVTTDAAGHAAVPFSASDPGSPRGVIDGQVFGVGGAWATAGGIVIPDAASAIAIRVFSGFTIPAHPTWDDVRPIFEVYAKLYPSMTEIIDLSDLAAVTSAKDDIRARLLLPVEDPGFMPVSRDLSLRKRDMIVAWIDAGCPQ